MLAPLILRTLPLLLLLILPTTAYVCYPTHPLPYRTDCMTLILGLSHLSKQPRDIANKHWGRTLSTGPRTEMLPRWYYLVDESQPAATCGIVVDAGGDPREVGVFSLADVVEAMRMVYRRCLVEKGQVGLEFPGEGHIFAKLMRLEGPPGLALAKAGGGRVEEQEQERRVVVPAVAGGKGKGVLVMSGMEPGERWRGNNESRVS
ncbi:MAG: hypothetical protein LQ349_000651 [Xanthoria aureola]|nr:MAG: hypothetical protein LQ349_000651 [Xanthoria aureola]